MSAPMHVTADAAPLDAEADSAYLHSSLPSVTVLFPLISAVASMIVCVGYICAFCSLKRLRRHPASLVFGRCLYDLLFCAQLVFQLTRFKSALECKGAAVLMQFSMLASECCFAGISADLSFALTEPFHDYRAARTAMHTSILLANAAAASALGWLQREGSVLCRGSERGPECLPAWLTFEPPSFGARMPLVGWAGDDGSESAPHALLVCWVRSPPDGSINWAGAQLFFFLPVLAIYSYALHVYYGRAARRLQSGGLMSALRTRRAVLERSRKLLSFFNGYVLLQIALYLAMLLLSLRARSSRLWATAHYACAELFLVVLGARGIATVCGYCLSLSPRWHDARALALRAKRPRPAAGAGGGSSGAEQRACAALEEAAQPSGAAAAQQQPLDGAQSGAAWEEEAGGESDEDSDADDGLNPELNSALREEVLFFTAQGIERAILHAEAAAPTGAPPASAAVDEPPTVAAVDGAGGAGGAGCSGLLLPSDSFAALGPSFLTAAQPACSSWGPASRVAWVTRVEQGGVHTHGCGPARELSGSDNCACSRAPSGGQPEGAGGAKVISQPSTQPHRSVSTPFLPSVPSLDDPAELLPPGGGGGGFGRLLSRAASAAENVGGAGGWGARAEQRRARVTHRGDLRSLGWEGGRTTITLTDYEPDRFREIRRSFGVEARPLLESLRHKAKERFSGGRSGAFLYFSLDYRFIVKTCTRAEARTLRRLLPAYAAHVAAQPRTLLSRMLGLYCIQIYARKLFFVVMTNILRGADGGPQPQALRLPAAPPTPTPQPQRGSVAGAAARDGGGAPVGGAPAGGDWAAGAPSADAGQPLGGGSERAAERVAIHECYDLKGSWVDRHSAALAELRGQRCRCRYCNRRFVVGAESRPCALRFNRPCVPEQQLKDLDLFYKLNLRPALARELAAQLRADADFLAGQELMDYSLLVGVTRRRFDLQPRAGAASLSAGGVGAACALAAERCVREASLLAPLLVGELGSQRYEAEFVDGPAVYYLGIIDILQPWDLSKKREYVAKVLLGKNRHGISCVPPREYAERFKRRVVEAIVEGRD